MLNEKKESRRKIRLECGLVELDPAGGEVLRVRFEEWLSLAPQRVSYCLSGALFFFEMSLKSLVSKAIGYWGRNGDELSKGRRPKCCCVVVVLKCIFFESKTIEKWPIRLLMTLRYS